MPVGVMSMWVAGMANLLVSAFSPSAVRLSLFSLPKIAAHSHL